MVRPKFLPAVHREKYRPGFQKTRSNKSYDALDRAFSVSTVPSWNPLKRRLSEPFFGGIYQKILINTRFCVIFGLFILCSYFAAAWRILLHADVSCQVYGNEDFFWTKFITRVHSRQVPLLPGLSIVEWNSKVYNPIYLNRSQEAVCTQTCRQARISFFLHPIYRISKVPSHASKTEKMTVVLRPEAVLCSVTFAVNRNNAGRAGPRNCAMTRHFRR